MLVSDVVLYREGLAALLGRIDETESWLRCRSGGGGLVGRDDAADVVLLDLGSRSVDAAKASRCRAEGPRRRPGGT